MLDIDLNEVSRRMSNFNKNIQQKIKLAWSDVLLRITSPEHVKKQPGKQVKETSPIVSQVLETSINSSQMLFNYPEIELTTTEPAFNNINLSTRKSSITRKTKNRRQKLGTNSPGHTNAIEKYDSSFLSTTLSILNDKNQNFESNHFFEDIKPSKIEQTYKLQLMQSFFPENVSISETSNKTKANHVEPSPTLPLNKNRNVNTQQNDFKETN